MELTSSERKKGLLSKSSLAEAIRELSEKGYTVIQDVYDPNFIRHIKIKCDRALKRYVAIEEKKREFVKERGGHIGMFTPCKMPFMHSSVISNSLALQILNAVMDEDYFCTFYNTNTTWPGSGKQRIHRDTTHLFRELPFSLPIHMAVVNIPLVDFTLENGATEVWPGSHLITDEPGEKKDYWERAAHLPSERTVMPAGSLVVRDMRMWHRGMPNQTEEIRTMLALVYFRGFLMRDSTMNIPRSTWAQMSDQDRHLFRWNKIGR